MSIPPPYSGVELGRSKDWQILSIIMYWNSKLYQFRGSVIMITFSTWFQKQPLQRTLQCYLRIIVYKHIREILEWFGQKSTDKFDTWTVSILEQYWYLNSIDT